MIPASVLRGEHSAMKIIVHSTKILDRTYLQIIHLHNHGLSYWSG